MRKVLIILGALALAGLAVAAFWLGRPAYRQWKEKRCLEQARQFLAQAEYANASLSLRSALAANPASLEAARLMADLADFARSPATLAWRRRVVELDPNVTNKLVYAAAALRYESPPFPQAAKAIEEVRQAGQESLDYHLVAAQLGIKRDQKADGERHLREAIRLDPTNAQHQVNLAVLRLQSPEPGAPAEARAVLDRFRNDPQHGLQALRSLVADGINRKEFETAIRVSDALLIKPGTELSDRLQHLALLHETKNAAYTTYLARLQLDATNSVQVSDTALALCGLGEPAEALRWLRSLPAPRQKEMPVPLALAEAFMGTQDWAGLEANVQPQKWDELEFVRLAMLSRAQRQQDRKTSAQMTWQSAEQLAAERLETLIALHQMAQRWELAAENESVLMTLVTRFPGQRWALPLLEQMLTRRGNTFGLYRLYRTYLEREPGDVVAKNNVASTALLLNTDIKRAHQLAREVYTNDPNNAVYVSTYAYSLHLQGQTNEALRTLESLKPEDLRQPSVAAYYGAMLVLAGDPAKAGPYLELAKKASLLPEEEELVRGGKR